MRNWSIVGIVAALALSGCSGPRTYIHPEADVSYIKTVAVVPFASSSGDRLAGDKVRDLIINELLMANKFDVVEPGEVNRALLELGMGKKGMNGGVDLPSLKKLGVSLKAQAVIIGDVREYGMVRTAADSYPVVGITVRLVDIETGKIAWMSSHTQKGGPGPLFFSFGETHTLSQMAEKVCHGVVKSIISKAY